VTPVVTIYSVKETQLLGHTLFALGIGQDSRMGWKNEEAEFSATAILYSARCKAGQYKKGIYHSHTSYQATPFQASYWFLSSFILLLKFL